MRKCILSLSVNQAMNYLLGTIVDNDYNFIAVENVYQAMQKFRSAQNIKYLIVDIDSMPDAWDLIQNIKTSKLYNFPVIVLSTENDLIVRRKCVDFGVDEIFFKPFDPLDIIATLNHSKSNNYIKAVH